MGLAKKDLLPNQDEGKNHLEGLGFGPISKKEGQDDKQVGGTAAEPCLEQNNTNGPETSSRIGTETGPRTVSEPGSPNNRAEYDLSLIHI